MHFCFTTSEITKYVLWRSWIFAHVIFRVYLGYPGLVLGRNEVKPYLDSVHHLCRSVQALHSLSSCSPPINFIFNPEIKKNVCHSSSGKAIYSMVSLSEVSELFFSSLFEPLHDLDVFHFKGQFQTQYPSPYFSQLHKYELMWQQ